MSDPKGFLKFKRDEPNRRPVEERLLDFQEMYLPFGKDRLKTQGARCMDCGVPFCNSHLGCPVENLIPEWNDLVHRGKWREALKALHATNNFPEFTGRLCPAPCESACVLGINQDPVSIRTIEWNIIEMGFNEGWVKPILPAKELKKSVGIIGSGPAGLAAAQELRRKGYLVTVYEKADRPGGLLRYGIPDFKMEKQILDRRLDQMRAEGVKFVCNTDVGVSVSVKDLLKKHEVLCLTVGAENPRDLKVPGRELGGIHFAMDYLVAQNKGQGSQISAHGKNVVIIGGGDTGSDCLGTAHRQGAKKVYQLELMPRPPVSRAPSTPWPLWPMKLRLSHAHEEGGLQEFSVSTKGFSGSQGRVERLNAIKVEMKEGKLFEVSGSEFSIDADLVLLAMGFSGVSSSKLLSELQLDLTSQGSIKTDSNYKSSHNRIYVAGDAKRGASLIVWAIAEGRKMAESVHKDLSY